MTGACVVSVIVAVAGVAISRMHSAPRRRPPSLVVSSPPVRLAGNEFAAAPGLSGVYPSLAAVAASGSTVVVAGSRAGLSSDLPLLLVSVDGGNSWRPAVFQAGSGAQGSGAQGSGAQGSGAQGSGAQGSGAQGSGALGSGATGAPGSGASGHAGAVPVLIAGGRGRWLALGIGASWTSHTGRSWTAGPGIAPAAPGDRVLALARTGSGFVAVGEQVSGQARAQREPVLWTSPDGRSWQRRAGRQLHLRAPGRVGALRWVAARGNVIMVGGEVTRTVVRKRGKPKAAVSTRQQVWRSTDGGARWSRVSLPAGHGAARRLAGLAATRGVFVAVRPGHTAAGRRDAVVYTSSRGSHWRFAGMLTGPRRAAVRLTGVQGDSDGAVVAGSTRGHQITFISGNGRSWHRLGDLGPSASLTVTGVAAAPGRTVVVAGDAPRGAPGPAGARSRPFLLLAGSRSKRVGVAVLAGDTAANVAVRGLAVSAGERVAVGSADGTPAIWSATGSGPWSPDPLPVPASDPGAGPGLTGVVHGSAGWLAVGGELGGVPRVAGNAAGVAGSTSGIPVQRPVLLTSPDGRTWRPAAGPGPFTPGSTLAQAAAGPSGYVVVGARAADGTLVAAAWFSSGLRTWTLAGGAAAGNLTGPGAARMVAVTAARSGFVAVGSAGPVPAVWTSPAGRTWRRIRLAVPHGSVSATLTGVTSRGGRVVAVGTESGHGVTAPFAAVSGDGGRTWRETALPAPGGPVTVTAVTGVPGGVVAVGSTGAPGSQAVIVWWSRDGQRWHAVLPRGIRVPGGVDQRITALSSSGHVLTGVGSVVTVHGQRPIRWLVHTG